MNKYYRELLFFRSVPISGRLHNCAWPGISQSCVNDTGVTCLSINMPLPLMNSMTNQSWRMLFL